MTALNETELKPLVMFTGGTLTQLDFYNGGSAACKDVVVQGRPTPDLPWQTLVGDDQGYRAREHILGIRTSDGSLQVAGLRPGVTASLWLDASGFTDVLVLASGLLGSDLIVSNPTAPVVIPPATNAPPNVAAASSVGVVTRYAREDHTHGTQDAAIIPITTPAGMVSTTVTGAVAELNTKINALPANPNPADAAPLPPGVAAVGTSLDYAREDHVHAAQAVPVASDATPIAASGAGGPGTSPNYARADHYHPAAGGGGSVTTVSVVSANGFAGTVANPTSAPAITLTTSITGILKGAAGALVAAVVGTDYTAGTAALGTGILKNTTGTGAHTIAVAADFPTLNQNTTGTAALATGVVGGVAGAVLWQSAAGTTVYTAAGTAGQLLVSNGTSAPAWLSLGGGDATRNIGYHNIPQNIQSAAYTLVLADAGKHILHPSADTTARIFTIPANASVAFPIGTAVTFVNQNAGGVITVAITTDVMRLAGAGTTGSRTLAANGVATALKITATEWIISGTGLT